MKAGPQAEAMAARVLGQDKAPADLGPTRPDTVEIFTAGSSNACDALCLGLLRGQPLDWVRISHWERSAQRQDVTVSITYALKGGLPVVVTPQAPAGLDLVPVPAERVADSRDGLVWIEKLDVLEAVLPEGNIVVARSTRLTQAVPTVPLMVRPHFRGLNSQGYELVRARRVMGQLDPAKMLAGLGYTIAPDVSDAKDVQPAGEMTWYERKGWKPPTPEESSVVASLLDASPDGHLPPEALGLVHRWIAKARWQEDLPPDAAALLGRIVAVVAPEDLHTSNVNQLLAKKPAAQRVLMPWVFDLLESPPTERDARNLLAKLERVLMDGPIAPDVLADYQPRLKRLLEAQPEAVVADPYLIAIAETFGLDPKPLLDRALGADRRALDVRRLMSTICALDYFPEGSFGSDFADIVWTQAPHYRRIERGSAFYTGLGLMLRDGQETKAMALLRDSGVDMESGGGERLSGEARDPTQPGFWSRGS